MCLFLSVAHERFFVSLVDRQMKVASKYGTLFPAAVTEPPSRLQCSSICCDREMVQRMPIHIAVSVPVPGPSKEKQLACQLDLSKHRSLRSCLSSLSTTTIFFFFSILFPLFPFHSSPYSLLGWFCFPSPSSSTTPIRVVAKFPSLT